MAKDTHNLSATPASTAEARTAEPLVDDVPEEVREAARRAFAERDLQAHVLPLAYDSLLAEDPSDRPRRLTFADVGAEVTALVHPTAGGREVEVEITCVGCSLVDVHCGEAAFPPDAPDRTLAGPAPHGLFSAVLESAGGRRLRTSWTRV